MSAARTNRPQSRLKGVAVRGVWTAALLMGAGCGAVFALNAPLEGDCRTQTWFFLDQDADGWGEPGTATLGCEGDAEGALTARNGLDCDDGDALVTLGFMFAACPDALLAGGDGERTLYAGVREANTELLVVVADSAASPGASSVRGNDGAELACSGWGSGVVVPGAVSVEGADAIDNGRAPVGELAVLEDRSLAVTLFESVTSTLGSDVATVEATVALSYVGSGDAVVLSEVWAAGVDDGNGGVSAGTWTGRWRWSDGEDVGGAGSSLGWCDGAPSPADVLGDLSPADPADATSIESALTGLRAMVRVTQDGGSWSDPCLVAEAPGAVADDGGRAFVGMVCSREAPSPELYAGFPQTDVVSEAPDGADAD